MKATILCVCALVCGCGPNTVNVDGVMSTKNVGPTVVIEEATCTSNGDCKFDQLCVVDVAASDVAKHTIMVCVLGCDAQLETVSIANVDGTSKTTTEKVAGTDTCQRLGDATQFCDLAPHLCRAYESAPPVKPEEPKSPVEVKKSTLKCCYFAGDDGLEGLWGQMAYSAATDTEPEAWKGLRDLKVGANGCFSAEVDMATVTEGFWVDLTVGAAEGRAAEDVAWKGESMKPMECFIGGPEAKIGSFRQNYGWPFGPAAK